MGLGSFGDDIPKMNKAISYLKKYELEYMRL